jgi:hypothetical protein
MLVSPLTFYRGAATIMAADLAQTPRSGVTELLWSYRRTLGHEHHPLEEFRYVHAAAKLVGSAASEPAAMWCSWWAGIRTTPDPTGERGPSLSPGTMPGHE